MYLTLDSTHHIDQVERGKGIFLLINKIFSRPYIQIVTCPRQNEHTKMQTDIGENITLLQKKYSEVSHTCTCKCSHTAST